MPPENSADQGEFVLSHKALIGFQVGRQGIAEAGTAKVFRRAVSRCARTRRTQDSLVIIPERYHDEDVTGNAIKTKTFPSY